MSIRLDKSIKSTAGGCALLFLLAQPFVYAGTLYKWVDEEGNVSYQDTPPPKGTEYTQQEIPDPLEPPGPTPNALLRAVRLFIVPNCDPCAKVRTFLEQNQIPFFEKDAESDEQARQELQELAGRLQVPVVTVGNGFWGGGSFATLEASLESQGYQLATKNPQPAETQPAAEPVVSQPNEQESLSTIESSQ